MAKIQYSENLAKKLKERIFSFMEDNLFAVIKVDTELIIFYNGLRISKLRNTYSIKDTEAYDEIENLFLLKLILNHMYNAVKCQEVTETIEHN